MFGRFIRMAFYERKDDTMVPRENTFNSKSYQKPYRSLPSVPQFECGFHQYLNFGKFKPPHGQRRTYYDLANMGEYGYLKWCLAQFDAKRPKIKIRSTCLHHIAASLQNENGQGPWVKKNVVEGNRAFMLYTAFNQAGKEVMGPKIEIRYCKACDQSKCSYMFTQQDQICDTCIKGYKLPRNDMDAKDPGENLHVLQQVTEVYPILPSPQVNPNASKLPPIVEESDIEEFETALRLRKMMRQVAGNYGKNVEGSG